MTAPRRSPSSPLLAAAASLSALLAALASWVGLSGPWTEVALVAMGITFLASMVAIWASRQQYGELDAVDVRGSLAAGERDLLQRELDRHAELDQQLVQAKQAAEAAVLAKGEFLATMSHEIRTPLNGIVPMLDLLSSSPLGTEQRELLRTATESSQQLLRIVDDILDYSKLEANRLELEITTFNLRELLDGVLQLMHRPAHNKGLRLELQLDPSVRLPVRGDPVRLRQILSNLIGNAVKFTERGAVVVVVRRLGEAAAQHHLRFEVRDTGIGIDAASQGRLFQSFAQADASTTRLYGGTGLGLAICKRIVDLMGGQIGVQSERGEGATFWFEIPLLKVVGDLRAKPSEQIGGHVLLVSPDVRLRQRAALLLPNWGMRVTAVSTAQEALERLRTATGPGQHAPFVAVVGDLDALQGGARALHRGLTRTAGYEGLRLLWLYGDTAIPDELRTGAALLSRQSPDADLRQALTGGVSAGRNPAYEGVRITAASANIPGTQVQGVSGPWSDAPVVAPAAAAASVAVGEIAGESGQPRLLLVEDNPVNLLVAQKLLAVLGYTSDSAVNGELALAKMSQQPYDLVLMDCQMPVLDGYAATRRWREMETRQGSTRRLPIIAMTANAMAGDRQRCLQAGMDDYLSKPVAREHLEGCLRRWLPAGRISVPVAPGAWTAATPTGPDTPTPDARAREVGAAAQAQAPVADAPAPASAPASAPFARMFAAAPVASDASAAVLAQQAADASTGLPTGGQPAGSATGASAPHPGGHDGTEDPDAYAPATGTPVLDIEILDELREFAGDDTVRIIALFLEDAPKLISQLETGSVDNRLDAMREAAHALKSSAANVGALALSAAAKRIELAARAQKLDRPAVAVALVIAEFARVRLALQGYADRLEGDQPSSFVSR